MQSGGFSRRPGWKGKAKKVQRMTARFQTPMVLSFGFLLGLRTISPLCNQGECRTLQKAYFTQCRWRVGQGDSCRLRRLPSRSDFGDPNRQNQIIRDIWYGSCSNYRFLDMDASLLTSPKEVDSTECKKLKIGSSCMQHALTSNGCATITY